MTHRPNQAGHFACHSNKIFHSFIHSMIAKLAHGALLGAKFCSTTVDISLIPRPQQSGNETVDIDTYLGCKSAYILMCKILTNRIRALQITSEYLKAEAINARFFLLDRLLALTTK